MKYTYGNRASIMTSDWDIYVFCKEQLEGMVKIILEQDTPINFEVQSVRREDREAWCLTIHELSWMFNISNLAQKFMEYDYESND